MDRYIIAPSILAADFSCLGAEVKSVLSAGADVIHFDVMDNHYVPNLSIGPMVCGALRKAGVTAPIDVHLMVRPVDEMIRMFADVGATYISFHPEASDHVDRSLQLINELGCKGGLVFNPGSSIEILDWLLDRLDIIVLMSVNPGFSGQKFLTHILNKIRLVRDLINSSSRDILLEVDGGICVENIADVAAAGADMFVAGSAIFGSQDYSEVILQMRAALEQAVRLK
ncbi:MAG: ribulose-phosphate 3-epimerase [Porticoccaceae bacterium]|nr:ribulose-phosphate 3-epimerase [Porticoccaceae bacterium]|tara:strand:- start:22370 stop:23050 length:681 start_codon:yes stop_codon:yes gene_type:complete